MRGIWIVSPEDTTQRLLLRDDTNSYRPRWSSDGQAIHVVPDDPPWRVVRVGYPGADTMTVLHLPVGKDRTSADLIDCTPDLRRVVYAEGEDKSDVWLLEDFDPEVN